MMAALEEVPNPHFSRIGGEEVVQALVEAFYREMESRPAARAIRAMHEADLSRTKVVLTMHLVEWLGGPRRYSAERGHPRLRARHARFTIGPTERDAWLTCMDAALDQVVADAGLRSELRAAFRRTANAVVNQAG
jgi:hemoglobin